MPWTAQSYEEKRDETAQIVYDKSRSLTRIPRGATQFGTTSIIRSDALDVAAYRDLRDFVDRNPAPA